MTEEEVSKKLEKELDVCDWKMLHPHFIRNSLYFVDEGIDFIETCSAAALNNASKIQRLIDGKLLTRPDGYDVEKWLKEKPLFKCLIISPHVFIQLTDISLKKS